MSHYREHLFWLSLTWIIMFSGYCTGNFSRVADPDERSKYMALYKEAYEIVKSRYPDQIKTKPSRLMEGAVTGLFESLGDPYSVFLNHRFFSILNSQLVGTFGGVGFSITQRKDEFLILYTLPQSPARRAGLKPRDRIIKINGKSVKNLSLIEVIQKLRGPEKSSVNLTVKRQNKTLTVKVTRDVIQAQDIETAVLDNNIGYLYLKNFSNSSAFAVREALLKLKKQGIKSLIFDLRDNPGGNLNECLYIVNFFLKGNKPLIYIKGNDANGDITTSHDRVTIFPDLPLVVLGNGGSASASEIFIGAIQDHERGLIIGEKTFGKGSVQTYTESSVIPRVGYKVTHKKWYTPDGRIIDHKGLEPDIKVAAPELTLDDKYYITKLLNSNKIADYVEKHPNLKPNEIRTFIQDVKSSGYILSDELIIRLLKSEKYLFQYEVALDMEYDKVLKKAWMELNKKQ